MTGADHSDWSAPGAPPGPRPTRPAVGVLDAPRTTAGVAVARGDDPVPPEPHALLGTGGPLAGARPVGVLGVLDGGFELLRFRFPALVGVAAAVLLPLQLAELLVVLGSDRSTGTDPLTTPASFEFLASGSAGGGWSLLFALAGALASTWVGLVVGTLVASWWSGVDLPVGRAVGLAARRWWVVPVLTALTLAIKVPAACVAGVGFVVADAFVFTAAVAAGAERLGPLAAVRRSFVLSRRNPGTALGVAGGGLLLTLIVQVVVLAGPLLLISSLGVGGTVAVVVQQAAGLVVLVTVPLTSCIAARAWVEFRCRSEGADLGERMVRRGLA